MPHSLRTTFIDMTGRDENSIRVVTPDIGGGFGPKLVVYQEDIVVALASKMIGRPVKWISERSEGILSDEQAREKFPNGWRWSARVTSAWRWAPPLQNSARR